MKISRERFEELVSAYLDNELSDVERELLSRCVRENETMAAIFYNACRIHTATCKMYGRKAVFSELDGVKTFDCIRGKHSKCRVAAEWTGVAALMALSIALMAVAVDFGTVTSEKPQMPQCVETAELPQIASVVSEQIDFHNGVSVGVIRIVGQSPLLPQEGDK